MPEKKSRSRIPQETKIRSLLQKEIGSICPFCDNDDVGHFQIHHIDENPSNNEVENLILICPTCHSKITKGDIRQIDVWKRKVQLASGEKKSLKRPKSFSLTQKSETLS